MGELGGGKKGEMIQLLSQKIKEFENSIKNIISRSFKRNILGTYFSFIQ